MLQSPPVFWKEKLLQCLCNASQRASNPWALFTGEMVLAWGGVVVLCGFLFVFFPSWGKEGKVNTEHILFTLFLVFFLMDEWQRLVVFLFSQYREKRKYLLL